MPSAAGRPLRVLTFTTLYPNAAQARHGIFVEQRLRQLLASGRVEARVLAPVPWFPSRHPRFGRYAEFARAPRAERRHGIDVRHPRYPVLPKIGMTVAPRLLAAASVIPLRALQRDFDFDLIDAHYFYPDGVAAALLGRRLGKPVTITARGSDVNIIPDHAPARRQMLRAARDAAALIVVADALKQRLVALGVRPERIDVLRNGVDLRLFAPDPGARRRLRAERGLDATPGRRLLLSVGNLIALKGHDLTLRALAALPDCDLIIIGDGPERAALQRLAGALGVAGRVSFTGTLPQPRLNAYYNAADALVLASSSEGLANVLLEAMACGLPVAATRVGGTAEVVGLSDGAPASGVLIDERSPAGIAAALRALFAANPDRAATRRYAERFGWERTVDGLFAVFERVAGVTGNPDRHNTVC